MASTDVYSKEEGQIILMVQILLNTNVQDSNTENNSNEAENIVLHHKD